MQAKKAKRAIKSPAIVKSKIFAGPAPSETPDNSNEIVAKIIAKIDELNKAHDAFKAQNDKALADLKAGRDDVVSREHVDRINASVGEVQGQIEALNRQLTAMRVGGSNPAVNPARAAHSTAFNGFIRKGKNEGELRALEVRAALSTDSDPDGGYVVPETMDTEITRVISTISAMRGMARVVTISGNTFKKLHNLGGSTSGWVGEAGGRTETSTPKLSELAFTTGEIYAMPAATQTMLDDGMINVEGWLSEEIAVEFAEKESAAFITGDGINKPKGLLSHTTVANASYAWGKLGYVAAGASGDFAAASGTLIPSDKLIDLVHALRPQYRGNAQWLMNDLSLAKIRKLKDGENNYVWQPSITVGQPSLLFGYAVMNDDNMQDFGANTFPLAFGDFNRGYLIVDRAGIRVLRDPYSSKPYVLFYTTKRVGGGVIDYAAIKLLKAAAS